MTAAETSPHLGRLIAQVEQSWPIGPVMAIERLKLGLVNQTFRIETIAHRRYILRLYHPDITSDRIRREHALLRRLDQIGFALAPRLLTPFEPPTWKSLSPPRAGHRHMALMTYLPGDAPYTWDRPPKHPTAANALGAALARYHRAVQGWQTDAGDPIAAERETMSRLTMSLKSEPRALECLAALGPALAALDRRAWPVLVVHGDFHAANVRWRGTEITGLFDFDYADHNWRLYDVATAVACLAFAWDGSDSGRLQVELMQAFLNGYDNGLGRNHPLPGLSKGERAALPLYLTLAQLLTLEWSLMPGALRRLKNRTAARYRQHARQTLAWLQENEVPL